MRDVMQDKFGGDVLLERLCRTAGLAEDTEVGFIWVRNNSDAYPHATNSHRVRVTRRTWEYLDMLPRKSGMPASGCVYGCSRGMLGSSAAAGYQQRVCVCVCVCSQGMAHASHTLSGRRSMQCMGGITQYQHPGRAHQCQHTSSSAPGHPLPKVAEPQMGQ
jgi:hypothetical protein